MAFCCGIYSDVGRAKILPRYIAAEITVMKDSLAGTDKLGPRDRWIGSLFYRMKTAAFEPAMLKISTLPSSNITGQKKTSIKSIVKSIIVDTGLYELIFRPRLTEKMLEWIEEFHPDIIFAQGYCLTFTWLPVMLKKHFGSKLAFFTTDDWPAYLYSGQHGEVKVFTPLMKRIVKSATTKLISAADIPFAFGQPMAEEYEERYKKKFITLSHADRTKRFSDAVPIRCHAAGIFTILAAGAFNRYRWPLLMDANECCRLLNEEGIHTRVAVLCSAIDSKGAQEIKRAQVHRFI